MVHIECIVVVRIKITLCNNDICIYELKMQIEKFQKYLVVSIAIYLVLSWVHYRTNCYDYQYYSILEESSFAISYSM